MVDDINFDSIHFLVEMLPKDSYLFYEYFINDVSVFVHL